MDKSKVIEMPSTHAPRGLDIRTNVSQEAERSNLPLPPELRNTIFEMALTFDENEGVIKITHFIKDQGVDDDDTESEDMDGDYIEDDEDEVRFRARSPRVSALLGLTKTCREINDETSDLIFRLNTFSFAVQGWRFTELNTPFYAWLSFVSKLDEVDAMEQILVRSKKTRSSHIKSMQITTEDSPVVEQVKDFLDGIYHDISAPAIGDAFAENVEDITWILPIHQTSIPQGLQDSIMRDGHDLQGINQLSWRLYTKLSRDMEEQADICATFQHPIIPASTKYQATISAREVITGYEVWAKELGIPEWGASDFFWLDEEEEFFEWATEEEFHYGFGRTWLNIGDDGVRVFRDPVLLAQNVQ